MTRRKRADINVDEVSFSIVDTVDLDAEARWRGQQIAYANCVRDGRSLQLADIQVTDCILKHASPISRRIASLFGRPTTIGLRGRGIGSRLLATVIRTADITGIIEIWGWVTHEDLARQPHLLAWYERHGFNVEEPDSASQISVPGYAKRIVRRR